MYDVIVLGGGIAGLGIAQAASTRGLRVLVIEKNTLASETSDNSLRIIHGGFRYLQSLDLLRVVMSRRAQAQLLKKYPDQIQPLECVMPLARSGLKSRYPALLASKFYNLLGKVSKCAVLPDCKVVQKNELNFPIDFAAEHYLTWWDASLTAPQALINELVKEITSQNSELVEQVKVRSAQLLSDGVELELEREGEVKLVSAKYLVNATGPWVEQTRAALGLLEVHEVGKAPCVWSRAFNLLLSKTVDPERALGFQSRSGALFFLCPRANGSALGTGYLPLASKEISAKITDAEVEAFLSSANSALPSPKFSMNDVVGVESGVLPVKSFRDDRPVFYGTDQITTQGRYIEILSTKYTTFQNLGERVVRQIQVV